MLNTIKTMIQEKSSFLEAADVIFEDGANLNLDDQIILGLESTDDVPMDGGSEELSPVAEDVDETEDKDDHEENKNDEEDDLSEEPETVEENEEDIIDSNIDDGSTENDVNNNPDENDDILDAEIDDTSTPHTDDNEELSLPGDDLPGTHDNTDGDDNILNAEIDLGSNTIKDILPVPPANAGDVIPGTDDTTSQHVDSGFSGEDSVNQQSEEISSEEDPIIGESTEDETKEEVEKVEESFWNNYFSSSSNTELYSEAITIGDEEPEAAPSTEAPTENKTSEETSEEKPAEEKPEENQPAEESPVTTAVKDKVAEMNIEEPAQKETQQDLLKKLGNITKSLEDAKKAVMNSIQ